MTQSVSVLNDTTFIAVNVHAHSSEFQCKLHAHTSIAALTAQLVGQLSELAERKAVKDYLATRKVQWALEYGPVRRRLSPETTLDEAGVHPGADLYLTQRSRTEEYPVLRDDVADGAAEASKKSFRVLDGSDTRRLGVVALPSVAAVLSAIGVAQVFAVSEQARIPVAAALGVLALMCTTLAAVMSRMRREYADVSGSLSIAAYITAAAAAVVAVPRDPGVWHVTTAGAAVGVLVAVLGPVTKNRPASLHVGAGVLAFCAVFVGVVHLLLDASSQSVASQLLFLSVVAIVFCTQISRQVGNVRVNRIPTTGEPILTEAERKAAERGERVSKVAKVSKRSTSSVAIEAILNQENRVNTTLKAMIGMVTAAGILMVASATALGYFSKDYEWHAFALVAAASVVAVAVGRGLVSRDASLPLLVTGPLAACGYLLGRSLSPHPADATVIVAGAVPLLIFVIVAIIWAVRAQSLHSPLSKRRLEIIATLAVIGVFPLVVFIAEGWSRIRNR
ncbi:type VII secretion integral membrane protein EccD [Mycobacterium koreense]|uniref:Type VII secretion integral membrane protein EccD n=1 Tax=Mycolicibacillus koreensis TaxID=1069220 RepID=A0AA91SSI0_9MYCO|nr:type VII secretion integral membrane protein EccD [Mycolicibacillus koreensis]MCV7247720.1 type VII secretion integral membrane protein EccD [Mycolicibacillus koreensis]OSC34797.1 type VII secretion integral membrane protein EccD [Mycolicibacillus koreensis]